MSEEILINSTPNETRVALVESGMLQEVLLERNRKSSIVGNIYIGRVEKVLPGLQAAFVNIGIQNSAFMHVSDICSQQKVIRLEGEERQQGPTEITYPSISKMVYEGQKITVQVYKDAIASKGARVTCKLSIPSRFLVLLPDETEVTALSIRINDEEERTRLLDIIQNLNTDEKHHGLIARTNAEGSSEDDLTRDYKFLHKLWSKVSQRIKTGKFKQLVYQDFNLPTKTIRDFISTDVRTIRTDSFAVYTALEKFIKEFVPQWQGELIHYKGVHPIFDFHNIDDEINRALRKFVPLKSGGNLVIDQNEAMTTIDVNTGKFVGFKNQEETIFRTNLEAAQMIARQLRLRNLGGIIIADFIDMNVEEHRQQVLTTLENYLAQDPTRTYVHGLTQLCLVEITRKRTTENLQQMLSEQCQNCQGLGLVKTVESVCYELFREIIRAVRQFQTGQIMVLASTALIDYIYDEQTTSLAELEEELGKRISLQAESSYSQEQFDVVLM
ncbi:Ribonuclease G [hydrothermal vent metagenome]|uniref:Ribonuclease G n=1 Tax=hydrothermal vent metagenome TaxID=652676 RepID=A0A3B0VBR5_9ZZZZ